MVGRDADVAALPPKLHASADTVDEFVFLDAVLRPLGVELKLLAALLPGPGNRDEVLADPPGLDDLVGDAFVVEPEMPRRLVKGRVDDGVLNDDLRHDCPGKESIDRDRNIFRRIYAIPQHLARVGRPAHSSAVSGNFKGSTLTTSRVRESLFRLESNTRHHRHPRWRGCQDGRRAAMREACAGMWNGDRGVTAVARRGQPNAALFHLALSPAQKALFRPAKKQQFGVRNRQKHGKYA